MSKRETMLLILAGLLGAYVFLNRNTIIEKGSNLIMALSENGKNFLKNLEGFSAKIYKDANGWSIGYGHYLGTNPAIKEISREQAEAFLIQDTATAENAIKKFVKVSLNQNQHDALISFIYNIGVGGFSGSTVLKMLNAGKYKEAADAMRMWNKSQGKINPVLVTRRESERNLFLS